MGASPARVTFSAMAEPQAQPETTDAVTMEKIVSLARRRGFVFPSSEIYGGLGAAHDCGRDGDPPTDNGHAPRIARRKPPLGIAQIGKSFRNEITPGNFLFRTREFEQMEMEFFVPPAEAEQWYRYWIDERLQWYTRYGLRDSHLRIRPHDPDELSHYSSGTSDIEYLFPIGWSELEGIANRGDYDLTQ